MQPRSSRTKSVTFAAFELDLSAGELRHEGVRVRLQEQPFQILAMLLERPGEVVTREELRTRLWPSDTFVDFDHGLNKAVNKLRAALGDTSEHAQFVETLPRRGYRFLVSVYDGRQTSPQHGTVIDSIAVFSLSNPSPDPDTDYLAVGIPGSIIHRLSQIPGLRVIAWNSVAQVEDCDQDPLAIGRRLKAKAVLVGRIWQRESKLRLHLDLLDTESGEELWGDQYDRNLAEIFSVRDDIAREVSAKLRLKMTGEAERRLTRRYTKTSKPTNFMCEPGVGVRRGAVKDLKKVLSI